MGRQVDRRADLGSVLLGQISQATTAICMLLVSLVWQTPLALTSKPTELYPMLNLNHENSGFEHQDWQSLRSPRGSRG